MDQPAAESIGGQTPAAEAVAQEPRLVRPAWATLLSILTVLVAVGTVTLHVVGAASHRAYMQYWGIDAGVFPKTTDLVLINGYASLVNQSASAFSLIVANIRWWTAGAVGLAIYLFFVLSPWDAGAGKVSNWLSQRPQWIQRLVRYLIAALALAAVVPVALIVWTLVMAFPDALGQANGKQHAEREAFEYVKGCEKSKYPCVELKRGHESLGSGFILDGSPAFVAIFDSQRQRARVIPREGIEMISARGPILPAARLEDGK